MSYWDYLVWFLMTAAVDPFIAISALSRFLLVFLLVKIRHRLVADSILFLASED